MSKSRLEKLDEKIRNNHTRKLLRCKKTDVKQIEEIEGEFCEDLKEVWVSEEEGKELFKRLRKSHLG